MKSIITTFALCLVLTFHSLAQQPGTLDLSFGENGKAVISLQDYYAEASTLQADGKICYMPIE